MKLLASGDLATFGISYYHGYFSIEVCPLYLRIHVPVRCRLVECALSLTAGTGIVLPPGKPRVPRFDGPIHVQGLVQEQVLRTSVRGVNGVVLYDTRRCRHEQGVPVCIWWAIARATRP